MEKITSAKELKNAIQLLEIEHLRNTQLLKEQFHTSLEVFKPFSLFKKSESNSIASTFLIESVLIPAIGYIGGYMSKKIMMGSSANVFRKIAASIFQSEITHAIVRHPDAIRSFGQLIVQLIFRKKNNTEKQ
jgi:hypothetical protein